MPGQIVRAGSAAGGVALVEHRRFLVARCGDALQVRDVSAAMATRAQYFEMAGSRSSAARRISPYIIGSVMGIAYGVWVVPSGALAVALAFAFLGGLSLVVDLAVKNAIALGEGPSPDERTARGARAAAELKGFVVAARVAFSFALASGLLGVIRQL